MAAVELNLNPSDRMLRQFGWIGAVALPLLGWLFSGKPTPSTWEPGHAWTLVPCLAVALLMGVFAVAKPSLLKWLFVAVSVITFPIGFVVGELVMFTIYLLVFAPVAIFFRFIGRDALQRNLDRDAPTYWDIKQQPKDATSYYRQS